MVANPQSGHSSLGSHEETQKDVAIQQGLDSSVGSTGVSCDDDRNLVYGYYDYPLSTQTVVCLVRYGSTFEKCSVPEME